MNFFDPGALWVLGWRNLHVTVQITGFPVNFSNPHCGNSKDLSAGKCHLLYFVVVMGYLNERLLFEK